jgi:hypothetical protein
LNYLLKNVYNILNCKEAFSPKTAKNGFKCFSLVINMKDKNDLPSTPFTAESQSYRDALSGIDVFFQSSSDSISQLWETYSPISALSSGFRSLEDTLIKAFPIEKSLRNFGILSLITLISNPAFGGSPFLQGNIFRILIDLVFLVAVIAAFVCLCNYSHREYTAYQARLLQERRRRYLSRERACRRDKPVKHLHKLDGDKVLTKQS